MEWKMGNALKKRRIKKQGRKTGDKNLAELLMRFSRTANDMDVRDT